MKLCRLRVHFTAEEPLELPPYKGSTFRGSFGYVFKRLTCLTSHHQCEGCRLQEKCAYYQLFHAPAPDTGHIPPPYIIEPPLETKTDYNPGDTLTFDFIAIGAYIDYTMYYIHAFEQMGNQGVGRGRRRIQLRSVASIGARGETTEIYNHESGAVQSSAYFVELTDFQPSDQTSATLQFETPVQIQHKGKLIQGPIPFRLLVQNLIRRWKMLARFHGKQAESDPWNWQAKQLPPVEILDFDLAWTPIQRWSASQKQKHPISGLQGHITYHGKIGEWLPLLRLGEWMHVGKKTSFGLGKYRLEEAVM